MTNYEQFLSELTVARAAELILADPFINSCRCCIYHGNCKEYNCMLGIESWLLKEKKDHDTD